MTKKYMHYVIGVSDVLSLKDITNYFLEFYTIHNKTDPDRQYTNPYMFEEPDFIWTIANDNELAFGFPLGLTQYSGNQEDDIVTGDFEGEILLNRWKIVDDLPVLAVSKRRGSQPSSSIPIASSSK